MAVMLASAALAQIADFATTDFRKADSVARSYPRHSLQNLKLLSEKLTSSLATEPEKFRAIYTWICLNIENDYTLFQQNKSKRKKLTGSPELATWNKEFSKTVFETLLKKHRTVCTGYAYLVQDLATHAGLSCVIVNGYGRTVQANIGGPGVANHSWNAVQLNNKWYLCDATWSSGAIDDELKIFVPNYNDIYFLLEPSLFVRNHHPLDTAWMLLEQKPTLNEFMNRPLVYVNAFELDIRSLSPESFQVTAAKGERVTFRFTNASDKHIGKACLHIRRHTTTRVASPDIYQDEAGRYCIDFIFTTKGPHVVHILLNDQYIVTYTVTVV